MKPAFVVALIAVAALVGAALTGAWPSAARADAPSSGLPSRSSYLCFEAATASAVMAKANEASARGWEMVAAAPGDEGSIWCFRQPTSARPANAR